MSNTGSTATHVAELLKVLGYEHRTGWVAADQFSELRAHRFALVHAREFMSVAGAFCWLRQSDQKSSQIEAPLVYLAVAVDHADAQRIHRLVWSQGLVPYLVIVAPDEVIICEGFRYESDSWHQIVKTVSWADVTACQAEPPSGLRHLAAQRLRGSVFWREHALDVSGRVDLKLLDVLEDLSANLICGKGVTRALSYRAANALLGKVLYVQFLLDRGIIDQQWLDERGHYNVHATGAKDWTQKGFWKLVDDLEAIFNGSIFPITKSDRATTDESHIRLVRSVLKHGAIPLPDGAVQLSFIDIDLSVLRVETLAAVYEQFLENVGSGERRRSGAYYTRPFLVDIVLDQIEETKPLEDGVRVLDPAAGSGVFLVGAYRRMLEAALAQQTLSLETIRALLVNNIFGIERNPDACHVAAFSLYLTMLDYTNPRELRVVSAGKDPRKLFPSLVGTNILSKDFFSRGLGIPMMDCIVGNPPWQKLSELGAPAAINWANAHHDVAPIGQDQAAELFVWKALLMHLKEEGVMAMLIPAKSFVNPTARKFRDRLTQEYRVLGAINFSHLRHRLFAGAKHACAAIFISNHQPTRDDRTWVYSPLSIGQPVASREDWPWTMVIDRSEIEYVRQSKLNRDTRAWFEAFMLRPVDRNIHSFINDQCLAGHIGTLGAVCGVAGAVIRRGGNSSETGIPTKHLNVARFSTAKESHTAELFEELGSALDVNDSLPKNVLAKAKAGYREQFGGNFTLVPRNFKGIRFIAYPKAYSSSYLGIFFRKNGEQVTQIECDFLRAVAKYLCSNAATYFMVTMGRRWLMDRSNVEPLDLYSLPLPISGPHDKNIKKLLSLEGQSLEDFLFDALELPDQFRKAIEEFLRFRIDFKDGNVPSNALVAPTQEELATYSSTMQKQLDEFIGKTGAFRMGHEELKDEGVAIVVAQFLDENQSHSVLLSDACRKAGIAYRQTPINNFSESLALATPSRNVVSLTKPLEYFRWTVESAYADSRQIIGALLATGVH